MRRGEFITLVALSGEEKKARAAGCDDYVPNHSVHDNGWRTSPAIAAGSIAAVHESAYAELCPRCAQEWTSTLIPSRASLRPSVKGCKGKTVTGAQARLLPALLLAVSSNKGGKVKRLRGRRSFKPTADEKAVREQATQQDPSNTRH
jgi:hypothetical protein